MSRLLKMTSVLLLPLLLPLMAQAYPLSCGDFIPQIDEHKREVLFEIFTGSPGDTMNTIVNVGRPHNWLTAELTLTQRKESTGMLSHKTVFQSGNRFRLEKDSGLVGGSDQWYITANLPEIGYVVNYQPIDCIGYY